MRRVIMLLPKPDLLQLANCHKYVTRTDDRAYSDIYTTTTIIGACADVDKILVIGHGEIGGFEGCSVDEVAVALIGSGMSLVGGGKMAFDTCFAGANGKGGDLTSALHAVKDRLKKREPKCNLELTGATGPSVTIGVAGAKRIVVDPANLGAAFKVQGAALTKNSVSFSKQYRADWSEGAPSATIKAWAQTEYSRLISFATDFRTALTPLLDTSPARKVTIQCT
jgi:hypothetical protein